MNKRRVIKWICFGLVGVLVLLAGLLTFAYVDTNRRMQEVYQVEVKPIPIPDDAAAIARGRHLALTRGCFACHSSDLAGKPFTQGFLMGNVVSGNLTSGKGGIGSSYSDLDWVRAIRHGIRPDGTPILMQPASEYFFLDDYDTGSLVAFLKQVKPVDRAFPRNQLGPLSRLSFAFGQDLIHADDIDHQASRDPAPEPAVDLANGAYLARSCKRCHGEDLKGGKVSSYPAHFPAATNITGDPEEGIGSWSENDFFLLMKIGERPDGTRVDMLAMPLIFGNMTKQELQAIWLYIQSVR